ncbi:MAG: Peptidyl-prolyl cis-trans isomerase, partial [uncultured Quadrisphaera sp.]
GGHAAHQPRGRPRHPVPPARPEDGRELHRARDRRPGVEGPEDRRGAPGPVLRRADLPPDHPRLHGAGRRPGRERHGRPRLRLRRRDPPRARLQRALQARHGQRRQAGRTGHQRLAVLHHRRCHAVADGQAHDLRRGRRRREPRRGRRHRRRAHRGDGPPEAARRHREGERRL